MRPGDSDSPLYMISVAARLVDCHPQTLRQYEDMGLLHPYRTEGKVRLYSDRDIEIARRIRHYTQQLGINRAGVEQILRLLGQMERMREEMEQELDERMSVMRSEIERLQATLRDLRGGPAQPAEQSGT